MPDNATGGAVESHPPDKALTPPPPGAAGNSKSGGSQPTPTRRLKEGCGEDIRAAFTEAASLARHYSALRFVMFSVFVTITGGLLAVEFDASKRPASGTPLILFRIGALFVVGCFALMMWRVGQLVNFYQNDTYLFEVRSDRKGLAVAAPPDLGRWMKWAQGLIFLPFLLVLLLWAYALLFLGGDPLW